MRRAMLVLLILAFLAGALSLLDVLVKDGVQTAIAQRIEARSPGLSAHVKIHSFPFVGRLAASGRVPSLEADVSGVDAGDLTFSSIDLRLSGLRVDRSELSHGQVRPLGIDQGHVVAVLSQTSIDAVTHLKVVLGSGTVGLAGLTVPATASLSGDRVSVTVPGVTSLGFIVKPLDLLPCIAALRIVPGAIRLSCGFRTLPSFLRGTTLQP